MILAIYYAPATNVLLHKSNIPCIVNRTVLDGCIGVTLDIHLDIECRDEDHEGLRDDGSHGSGVSSFTSVIALADGFLRVKHCLSPQ